MKYNHLYETISCNLCGCAEHVIKYRPTTEDFDPAMTFGASRGVMGTQCIVMCSNCGLFYANPRLKSDFIVSSYVESNDELYASQAEGRERTFKKSLHIVEKYSPDKGKILDVGAGAGFFLNIAKKNGWDVYGIEPSKWLSDYGRNKLSVNVQQGTLYEINYPNEFFDVVTMWDVLEHVADPLGELIEIFRILKKDGILVINYPDIGTCMARLAGRRWWFLLSVHLTYFSRTTLEKMLRRAGFEPIKTHMHIQTLSFGHLIKMFSIYNQTISRYVYQISRILKLQELQIPYYAGQSNMISKKIMNNA